MTDTPVTIKIDGEEYPLRYSVAAAKRIRAALKAQTVEDLRNALNVMPPDGIGMLLFEGIKDKKGKPPVAIPDLATLEELLDMREMNYYQTTFGAAWKASQQVSASAKNEPSPTPELNPAPEAPNP